MAALGGNYEIACVVKATFEPLCLVPWYLGRAASQRCRGYVCNLVRNRQVGGKDVHETVSNLEHYLFGTPLARQSAGA